MNRRRVADRAVVLLAVVAGWCVGAWLPWRDDTAGPLPALVVADVHDRAEIAVWAQTSMPARALFLRDAGRQWVVAVSSDRFNGLPPLCWDVVVQARQDRVAGGWETRVARRFGFGFGGRASEVDCPTQTA